ncbi:FG-GAP-like repeat-containing protein [Pseudomonadota bacterium]
MIHKKRIAIILLLIGALLAYFWLGSRYPAIDEKAAMAGDFVLEDVLSFEATFETHADDPAWKRVGLSTLNWIMTNRQGMTFGVLLASLVLTLLQIWPLKRKPGQTMRDILKGILIGAPLGVCVNCAAPIAYGMRRQGVHHATSLATMFASPTLNIIVVTMMFSLLPLYMATTRIVATFFFLLVLLPLLLRFAHRAHSSEGATNGPENLVSADAECVQPAAHESWLTALFGTTRGFLRNLLFIVVRTVPLMFLAGFLGTVIAILVPMESLTTWQVSLAGMAAVAVLGTFAPVPIAFDIVVVQALLVIGLPPEYAMVLLVTLGTFSIYPLLIVSKMLTWRFSLALFLAVSVLGVSAGYLAAGYESFMARQNQALFNQQFAGRNLQNAAMKDPSSGEAASNTSGADPLVFEEGHEAALNHFSGPGAVQIESEPFRPRSAATSLPFEKRDGSSLGLVAASHQLLDLMMPFSQGRGIAAGDMDNDGLPDLAVAQNHGVTVYRNIGGKRFEETPLQLPELDPVSVLLVAWVDMNNDGCLDLFAGTFGDRDYLVINDCGGFVSPTLVTLGHEEALMTQAASFADFDRDGDLDVLKGNWFFLMPRTLPSARNVNYMVENRGNLRFEQQPLSEIHGATLAVLLSDFNNDGVTDRIIGNDFMEPDIYYRGKPDGGFEQLAAGDVIPITTLATMSIDTADIDNDLDFDLFQSGKVNDFSLVRKREDSRPATLQEKRQFSLQRRKVFQQDYCAQFSQPADRARCESGMYNQTMMMGTRLAPCIKLPTQAGQDECMLTIRIKNAVAQRQWLYCRDMPQSGFPVHKELCDSWAEFDKGSVTNENLGYQYLDQGAIAQNEQGNVLLVQQADGRFVDKAEEYGVFDGRWAWTAKFADLDNDEWQDLFVVNGWWLETSIYSNQFFHNRQGQGFEGNEVEFGLNSGLKQHAFIYFDMDRDGDLDIITRSLSGDMQLWLNNIQANQSILFEFRDQFGNVFGIGNKITIHYGENGERHQIRELKSGGGFVSFDEPLIHFGLGAYDQVARIVVDWATGEQTEIQGPLEAGHRYTITRSTALPIPGITQ